MEHKIVENDFLLSVLLADNIVKKIVLPETLKRLFFQRELVKVFQNYSQLTLGYQQAKRQQDSYTGYSM